MSRAQRSADRLCRNQPPSRLLASRLLASCLLASSLWGCPDAEPDPDAGPYVPMGEARIEIGTGSSEFVPLLADSTLELIAGTQGGWHVDVSLAIYGLTADDLLIRIEGYDDATGAAIAVPVERVLTPRRVVIDGDRLLRLGDRLIFTITAPDQVIGKRLRIEVIATPLEGAPVTASTTQLIVDER